MQYYFCFIQFLSVIILYLIQEVSLYYFYVMSQSKCFHVCYNQGVLVKESLLSKPSLFK